MDAATNPKKKRLCSFGVCLDQAQDHRGAQNDRRNHSRQKRKNKAPFDLAEPKPCGCEVQSRRGYDSRKAVAQRADQSLIYSDDESDCAATDSRHDVRAAHYHTFSEILQVQSKPAITHLCFTGIRQTTGILLPCGEICCRGYRSRPRIRRTLASR